MFDCAFCITSDCSDFFLFLLRYFRTESNGVMNIRDRSSITVFYITIFVGGFPIFISTLFSPLVFTDYSTMCSAHNVLYSTTFDVCTRQIVMPNTKSLIPPR